MGWDHRLLLLVDAIVNTDEAPYKRGGAGSNPAAPTKAALLEPLAPKSRASRFASDSSAKGLLPEGPLAFMGSCLP